MTYITFSFSNHFMFVFHFRESNHIMLRNSVNISAIKLINGDCCRLTDVIFWSLVKYFFRPSNVTFDSNFFGKYLLQENNLFTLLKMRISNLYVAWVDTEWVPKILNYFLFAWYSPTHNLQLDQLRNHSYILYLGTDLIDIHFRIYLIFYFVSSLTNIKYYSLHFNM